MSFDINTLTQSMIDAARNAVANRWPAVRAVAEVELRKLAQTIVDIDGLLRSGAIDRKRAGVMLHMQQNVVRGALRLLRGIGLLTAEKATEAAIVAVAKTVNGVVKFRLLNGVTASFKAGTDL